MDDFVDDVLKWLSVNNTIALVINGISYVA